MHLKFNKIYHNDIVAKVLMVCKTCKIKVWFWTQSLEKTSWLTLFCFFTCLSFLLLDFIDTELSKNIIIVVGYNVCPEVFNGDVCFLSTWFLWRPDLLTIALSLTLKDSLINKISVTWAWVASVYVMCWLFKVL